MDLNDLNDLSDLTHLDSSGQARMVDVGGKDKTIREARAAGEIAISPQAAELLAQGRASKGDVLAAARIAGIMAAKKTAELIPLCHPVPLTFVGLDLTLDREKHLVRAEAVARTEDRTGVEMEALTAVSAALLTVYDMLKAVDKSMVIQDIRLLYKSGGRSGVFRRMEES